MDPSLVVVVHQVVADAVEDAGAGLGEDARVDANEGVDAVVDDAVAD
jgi:hypothetical protein